MNITADENIPLIEHYFGKSNVQLKPGRAICQEDLKNADILLVRSVTPVNQQLLHNTSLKFVGSTTIGADHLDTQWLDQQGIKWAIAKGCNAQAVIEYALSVLAFCNKKKLFPKKKLRAGVIGVGMIGSQIVNKLKWLGFDVVQNDPFLKALDPQFMHTDLENFVDLDFISIHTPLTHEGPHPTFHFIQKDFIKQQKPGCILLNTSRGAVIDFSDLKKYGRHLHVCLDVWENEPCIDQGILQSALIATPHIAGYSIQSKYRGIKMIYDAAVSTGILLAEGIKAPPFPTQHRKLNSNVEQWEDVVLNLFNPEEITLQMKNIKNPSQFDAFRQTFNSRHEFKFVEWDNLLLPETERKRLEILMKDNS